MQLCSKLKKMNTRIKTKKALVEYKANSENNF